MSFRKFIRKNRKGVSPVIATILLIGLAVIAGSAIILVVLPLLEAKAELTISSAQIVYEDDYTETRDNGNGYGVGTVVISNSGSKSVTLTQISISYLDSSALNEGYVDITNSQSLQGLKATEPYKLEPLAANVDLSIRFVIPNLNLDESVSYRIVLTDEDGNYWDTSKESSVNSALDMTLPADRPTITSVGISANDYIRREHTITPSIGDNAGIKEVTYTFTNGSYTLVHKTDATTTAINPFELLNWDTYELGNDQYDFNLTVEDWAGNTITSNNVNHFYIDNDYIDPVITDIEGSSVKNGVGTAEVGESYAVSATITDTGCTITTESYVTKAVLNYKLNDTSETYTKQTMTKVGNTFTGNIPAAFVDSDALDENLAFFITAEDPAENIETSSGVTADVEDTTEPDFTAHTPVTIADELEVIDISATVSDKDAVAEVTLVWRTTNDTELSPSYSSWFVSSSTSNDGNDWNFEIPSINSTLEGLDYYLNASDPAGNIAYDGSLNSPYHITVPDVLSPEITIRTPTPIPEDHTAGTALTVSVYVSDRDLTFSRTGDETGDVELGYRKYDGITGYTYIDMIHIAGDSSTGSLGIWEGTIPLEVFTATGLARVDFTIEATDQSTNNRVSSEYNINVVPGGTPIFEYVTGTADLSGVSDNLMEFTVVNSASGTNPATGTISEVEFSLINRSKLVSSGVPYLTQINVTGGSNPIWSNSTNDEGANATKLTLDESISLAKGVSTQFTLVYANSSGGYYDLKNFKVNTTLYYNYTTTVTQDGETSIFFRTPGAEPDYSTYSPYPYNGRFYVDEWLASPKYPYTGSSGWESEYLDPWTSDEYTRAEIAEGSVFPYEGYSAPLGSAATHTQDSWVHVTNNDGYRMNIDSMAGATDNHYIWFYAVITVDNPSETFTTTMYLGSDDEAICYINNGTDGSEAGSYLEPRGYGESTFTVTLKGLEENNYILFGVHEDGGNYRGGLAFSTTFEIKIYNQGPPAIPVTRFNIDSEENSPLTDSSINTDNNFLQYSTPLSLDSESKKIVFTIRKVETNIVIAGRGFY